MNKFVALEGLDGAGKSTQIKMLHNFFDNKKIRYKYLHFPRSGKGLYGDLIARFLRGEFGSLEKVSPYLVSLIYAGDRNDAKTTIKNWLKDNYLVIVDRYVYSNIAFQCAKLKSEDKKIELEKWLVDFEYSYNNIPKPDLSLYLNVPINFVRKELSKPRICKERLYLNGKKDIHELSIVLQKNVGKEYRRLSKRYDDIASISCFDDENNILSPDAIHKEIISKLKTLEILN